MTDQGTFHDGTQVSEGASQPRRQFLTQAGLLGLAAGGLMMNQASAQTTGGAGGAKAELFPGATDEEGNYVLPPLPYAYDALEPAIDAETMKLHHDKHHAGYVKGLIANEEALAKARQSGDFGQIKALARDVSFNGGGHFLHCIFWRCMTPGGKAMPAELKRQIAKDFGSEEAFRGEFTSASGAVEGSGWGILAWSVAGRKLVVLQSQNHNLLSQWADIPLLVVDVWEHAYYKKYGNLRGDYIKAFMGIVDWENVATRYQAVRQAFG